MNPAMSPWRIVFFSTIVALVTMVIGILGYYLIIVLALRGYSS